MEAVANEGGGVGDGFDVIDPRQPRAQVGAVGVGEGEELGRVRGQREMERGGGVEGAGEHGGERFGVVRALVVGLSTGSSLERTEDRGDRNWCYRSDAGVARLMTSSYSHRLLHSAR